MWHLENGVFSFRTDFPIIIGYATKSADQSSIMEKTILLKQIHSDIMINIDEDESKIGDGLYTRQKGVQLGVRVADCLPIYFFNPRIGMVGILHAGWRGTIKGISSRLNETLEEYYYAFGPVIGPECYEIGPELAGRFHERFDGVVVEKDKKYYLDLKKANRQLLKGKEIGDLDLCNRCDKKLSSHRRDGKEAGRDIAFIIGKETEAGIHSVYHCE